jgi:hypothetical protein
MALIGVLGGLVLVGAIFAVLRERGKGVESRYTKLNIK